MRYVALALTAVVLTGCTAPADAPVGPDSVSSGPTIVTYDGEPGVGDAAALVGHLNETNGCLFVDDHLVVLAEPLAVWNNGLVIDGTTFALGDEVTLGGGEWGENSSIDIPESCGATKAWVAHTVTAPY